MCFHSMECKKITVFDLISRNSSYKIYEINYLSVKEITRKIYFAICVVETLPLVYIHK